MPIGRKAIAIYGSGRAVADSAETTDGEFDHLAGDGAEHCLHEGSKSMTLRQEASPGPSAVQC
jgi:hypothetical protein